MEAISRHLRLLFKEPQKYMNIKGSNRTRNNKKQEIKSKLVPLCLCGSFSFAWFFLFLVVLYCFLLLLGHSTDETLPCVCLAPFFGNQQGPSGSQIAAIKGYMGAILWPLLSWIQVYVFWNTFFLVFLKEQCSFYFFFVWIRLSWGHLVATRDHAGARRPQLVVATRCGPAAAKGNLGALRRVSWSR